MNAYWNITENKNRSKLKENQYSCKYKMSVKYADGTEIEFVFKAVNRYSEFTDYETQENNAVAEEIEHLNDRTVLCLEDKSILFSKACELIHEALIWFINGFKNGLLYRLY